MKSIEQRKQALVSKIQQLRMELDNLKWPEYEQSYANVSTSGTKYLRPHRLDSKPQG